MVRTSKNYLTHTTWQTADVSLQKQSLQRQIWLPLTDLHQQLRLGKPTLQLGHPLTHRTHSRFYRLFCINQWKTGEEYKTSLTILLCYYFIFV